MKGFVPTPDPIVDQMVDKLFRTRFPSESARVLDPGCGTGAFIDGIIRWCKKHDCALPRIRGVEANPAHAAQCRVRFGQFPQVDIHTGDFLAESSEPYDFIIGNPPYVAITALDDHEKQSYRQAYTTAKGRFDLYLLFFEQALRSLKADGRLVFITPEKYLYVESAAPLRALLSSLRVEELHLLDERTFEKLVTYPLVTTIVGAPRAAPARVILRSGVTKLVTLPQNATSWLTAFVDRPAEPSPVTLADACIRISCGVATGADSVFTARTRELPTELREFAYPTIAGREIVRPGELPSPQFSLLIPYTRDGLLLPEDRLGHLGVYLSNPSRRKKLLSRTCTKRKPWYAFHETPPLTDILRPKILCKDIGAEPFFVVDRTGIVVPRHSVYYLVPKVEEQLDDLADYLNSATSIQWLRDHCQRAANGFIRLQSHVLKELPIPPTLAVAPQTVPSPVHKRKLSA